MWSRKLIEACKYHDDHVHLKTSRFEARNPWYSDQPAWEDECQTLYPAMSKEKNGATSHHRTYDG